MGIVDILSIVFYISIFQIVLISISLFIKKGSNSVNKFPVIALLIIWGVFTSGSFILIYGGPNVLLNDIAHLMNLSIFLCAPLMFVYYKIQFTSDYKFTLKELLHTVPFLLMLAYMFNKIIIEGIVGYVFYPAAIYFIAALFLQNTVYFFLIYRDLKALAEPKFQARLRMFRFVLYSVITLFLIKLAIFIVWNILRYVDICIYMTDIFFTIVFIIINSIVLFSLHNPDLLTGVTKYKGSKLSEAELNEHLKNITAYLNEGKHFTDPLMSLQRIAKNLRLSEKLISQVINQSGGINFNDFINGFRIKYVIEMMKNTDMKILEIAYESGFNSKTTFNSAFKKFTGLTPSEYRKEMENVKC